MHFSLALYHSLTLHTYIMHVDISQLEFSLYVFYKRKPFLYQIIKQIILFVYRNAGNA